MFFAIKNLVSKAVEPMDSPWDYKRTRIPDTLIDKVEYRKWRADYGTDHAFISCYEGTTPSLRVDTENPPIKVYGLIVDYDAPVTEEMIKQLIAKPRAEFRPAYAVLTHGGHGRLVWLYEGHLLLASLEQNKRFQMLAHKNLHLGKWLPGLDTAALGNASQYYEVGEKWIPMFPDARIPLSHLHLWLYEASKTISLVDGPTYTVPIEKVAEEVELRFPGRWRGPFELGRRGVRFWDPDAKDPTGAVVMQHGMMAFSGEQAFLSWKKIFGQEFVDRFEADRISRIMEHVVFDGREYWILTESGRWEYLTQENMKLYLKGFGLSHKAGTGGAYTSEVEQALLTIMKSRRVEKALPFVHFPQGIITHLGCRYLNTSRVKVIEPAPPMTEGKMTFADGRTYFPFIYKLLKTMFIDPNHAADDPQLEHHLAWVKYAYENAYNKAPKPGHVIVIAGITGKGKTFYLRNILGRLLGGHADAAQHLMDGSKWTEDLANSPLLCVDDAASAPDQTTANKFSFRLKSYVANAIMHFDQKYKQTADVPWYGRIALSCNLDSESLRILPSIDNSSRDKICFYRASDYKIKFPDWDAAIPVVVKELPFFARFLLDWDYPSHLVNGNVRFGIKAFHHPELLGESMQQGASGTLLEVLTPFLEQWKEGHSGILYYRGTASQLYQDLHASNPVTMAGFKSAQALAICLGALSKSGYNIRREQDRENGLHYWILGVKLLPASAGSTMEDEENKGGEDYAGEPSEKLAYVRGTEAGGIQQRVGGEDNEQPDEAEASGGAEASEATQPEVTTKEE